MGVRVCKLQGGVGKGEDEGEGNGNSNGENKRKSKRRDYNILDGAKGQFAGILRFMAKKEREEGSGRR